MMEVSSNSAHTNAARIGSQPIALAAATLIIIVVGVGAIALWRTYTGTSPEQDRVTSARQLQTRTAQPPSSL